MIAKIRSLIHIHNSINLLNKILSLFLAISLSLFLISYLSELKAEGVIPQPIKKASSHPLPLADYEKIGTGPLAVDSGIQSFPFPDLSREVLFLSISSRPDISEGASEILIGLKGNPKRMKVSPDTMLYLTYDENHLTFSEGPTPLWIKPKLGSLEMGMDLISENGELLLSERREQQVKIEGKPLKKEEVSDLGLIAAIQALEGARWWSPDRLFDQYAGAVYQKYKGLERLEILGKRILFSEEGKWFIWRDGEWEEGDKTERYPLAIIKEITPYKMDWQLWDASGLETVVLSFHRHHPQPLSIRPEDIFTRLRQRTTSRVSCRIDNHATILKVGDWLFRTESGWHTIKSSSEVDAIVKFKAFGELFIFDKLEKVDGKEVFCGSLFDQMRTELLAVRLPITQMKTLEHSHPAKKGGPSKAHPSTSSEGGNIRSNRKMSHKRLPKEEHEIFED
ncbi:MAG: hypothetical protein KDK76_03450 [Chlamydiia bacterium]|nr:hypothetical protein [Chlamydiia bacterium]